jgi:uncharacterized protein DUF6502
MSARPGEHLLVALRRILRPIIGILIRAGIRFDDFSDVARGVYVESAIRDGLDRTTSMTRARVSMVTGLTRQQIDYYLDADGALPQAGPTLANALIEVLQKWHTDPQYAGPYGIPLELEFETSSGRSFRSLVALVDSQISPGLVLEELLRVGSVTHSGENHFRAVSRYFMTPMFMSPLQSEHFGNTLTRLAKTLEHNMNPQNPQKRLERFVVADRGLNAEVLPLFERYARERTSEFLVDLDNWLTPHSSSDETDFSGRVGTGLNVFLYVESPEDEEPLASLVAPDPLKKLLKPQ